ncbi:MAG: primosomal replication protein N [Cytophagales bacterium]|nr:primosomal replication protein N [Rhizobacter sp.]
MNRVVLSAQLVERGAMRYTPAGLPACDFSLKHESQVTEAGQVRQISMEMRAVAIGEIAQRLVGLEIGAAGTFAGFLTNQRNGRGAVLHVTEFE